MFEPLLELAEVKNGDSHAWKQASKRKPGGRRTEKRLDAETSQSGIPNQGSAPPVVKTYGLTKSSRHHLSPVMNRGSSRNR